MPWFLLLSSLIIISFMGCHNSQTLKYSDETVSIAVPFAPGVVSTSENSEFSLDFTPDGRTVYFSRRSGEEKQKIYTSEFIKGKWTKPEVAPFSTDRDDSPSISPDGNYLFFASERPIPENPNKGNFDMNVWMMKRTDKGWSEPVVLPEPINYVQIEGEEWPSSNNSFMFTNDNLDYYFTTMNRGDKGVYLYRTNFDGTHFSSPEKVEGIFDDDRYWINSAVMSPDGQYLLFNSYGAEGGAGGEDIYVSKRTDTGWSRAKGIGAQINTSGEESGPRFSRDGKYLFYGKEIRTNPEEDGIWSIYFIETEYLYLEDLFK